MRRGAELAGALLVLLAAAAPAQEPETGDEDLAAALAELEALDQPAAAGELAELAAEGRAASGGADPSAAVRLRWRRDRDGRTAPDALVEAGGGAWDLRLRARHTGDGDDLLAGTAAGSAGRLGVRLGGWNWRHGFGLVAGAAGRTGSLAADAGLGPGTAGCRGWTGWPAAAAARGVALGLRTGWTVDAAWGRRDEGGALLVGALGRHSGAWRFIAVDDGVAGTAASVAGRWRRGAWRGAWEAAFRPAATGPALALQMGWGGRRLGGEAFALAVPRGGVWAPAATQPLLGAVAGTLGALRVRWGPAVGSNLAALAAVATRDGGPQPAPERRLVSDFSARVALPRDLLLEARLRTTARSVRSWAEDWPWAPPTAGPGRRTQAFSLALGGAQGGHGWRLRVVSLAVDHAPTSGRRNLASAELRGSLAGLLHWRLARRLAWGAAVDLADAVSPGPGVLVPRHWGHYGGGWFGRIGLATGPWRLDAAADLRDGDDGSRQLESWAGAGASW